MTRRPIKFRAWDIANKRWFYPPSSIDSSLDSFMMTSDGRVYIEGVYQDLLLCQFTGLHDKNGVEIYEGDILRGPVITNKIYTFKVPSLQSFHWFQELADALESGKRLEVIGNIYANPEIHCDY